MKASILKCASCGSHLAFSVSLRTAECPYCGTAMALESASGAAEHTTFDSIIPIAQSRESFYEKTLEFLAEGDHTPDDLLMTYKVKEDLHAVYLPFERFRGSYDGDFTCMVPREIVNYVQVRDNQGKVTNQKQVDTVWDPFQRSLKGKFVIDVCMGQGLEEIFLQRIQDVTVDQKLIKFSPDYIAGHSIDITEDTGEPDEHFRKRGYSKLNRTVELEATRQAPDRHKDIKVSFSHSIDQATRFLASAWLQTYEYRGSPFKVVMEGSKGALFGHRPQDEDRKRWITKVRWMGHVAWVPAIGSLALASQMPHSENREIFFWVAGSSLILGYSISAYLQRAIQRTSRGMRGIILAAVKNNLPGAEIEAAVSKSHGKYSLLKQMTTAMPIVYGALAAVTVGSGIFFNMGASKVGAPTNVQASVPVRSQSEPRTHSEQVAQAPSPVVAESTPEPVTPVVASSPTESVTEPVPLALDSETGAEPTSTTSASVAAGPSFNCAAARTSVEQMICADPEVARADAQVAAEYRQAMQSSGENASMIKLTQRAFLTRRNGCETSACIADAYRARHDELVHTGYLNSRLQ